MTHSRPEVGEDVTRPMSPPTTGPGSPEAVSAPLEIVVVTYCAPEYVDTCLRSALLHSPEGTVLHVVDNASPDGTADRIEASFPDIRLTRSLTNDGFAVGNNRVLRHVTAPYVLLLNPDARLEPGTLSHLLDYMADHADVGIVGCRLLTEDGRLDHAAKRSVPRPLDALAYFAGRVVGQRRGHYTAPHVADDAVADVDAVNGAFMLVRTSAMIEVGLLDERYWMYGEDLDWCVRFRRGGWRVVYDGSVVAHHAKGASAGVRSPRLAYQFHRSMAIFYRDHVASGPVSAHAGTTAIYAMCAAVVARNSVLRGIARGRRATTR